jgi:hypothetical protein
MSRPEYDLGNFLTAENTLEDGSTTHDVCYFTPYGKELVAEPPSEVCAKAIAECLNLVRSRFLDCGSDREVLRLTNSLYEWSGRE